MEGAVVVRVGDVVVDEFVHPGDEGPQLLDDVRRGRPGGDVGHVRLKQPAGDDKVIEDAQTVVLRDGRGQDHFVEHVPRHR